jgi:hypothetical protein
MLSETKKPRTQCRRLPNKCSLRRQMLTKKLSGLYDARDTESMDSVGETEKIRWAKIRDAHHKNSRPASGRRLALFSITDPELLAWRRVAEQGGRSLVHGTVGRKRDPIIALRRTGGYETVSHILCDKRGIAFCRIAHAAAARQMQHQALAVRDDLKAFRAERRPGFEFDLARSARQTAVAPFRRIGDPIENGVAGEFQIILAADLHDLAEAAPGSAGAAGIGSQFLAPDDDWRDVFGGFDRHGPHAGGEGGGVETVAATARARAA